METKEIIKTLEVFKNDLVDLKNKLDIINKKNRLTELDQIMSKSDFWSTSNTKEILEEVIYTISMSISDNYNVSTVIFNVDDEEIYKSVVKSLE